MKNVVRIVLVLAAGSSLYGQYAGPAILSRGQAPSMISEPSIQFRPYVSMNEVYDTGLANVAVTDTGELAHAASYGSRFAWGVSGSHRWRGTDLGLSYTGSYTRYDRKSVPTGVDQSFLMGVSHRLTRHILFSARESAGVFTRNYTGGTLSQSVQFDPSQSNIPTSDFFDNRTIFLTSQANMTIQQTARLSFDLGGNYFTNIRHSAALANATGTGASGDVQYRLTRRVTVGGMYTFNNYQYSRTTGGTQAHSVAGAFSMRAGRRLEFSGYAGVARVESKFIERVPIDPVIGALLGISSTAQIFHSIGNHPNVSARFSRSFHNGMVYLSGGHSLSAGNGLFLTSYVTTLTAGYAYTGLRNWSISAMTSTNWAHADANISGDYHGISGNMGLARKLGRFLHLTMNAAARQYGSRDFENYNRLIYTISAGVAFAPGDVPLRMW